MPEIFIRMYKLLDSDIVLVLVHLSLSMKDTYTELCVKFVLSNQWQAIYSYDHIWYAIFMASYIYICGNCINSICDTTIQLVKILLASTRDVYQ